MFDENGYLYWRLICDFKNYFGSISHNNPKLIKESKGRLKWLIDYIGITNNKSYFHSEEIPDLKRGNIILAELGFNLGKEFGGRHYCIVLRDSNKSSDRVLILPVSTQKPSDYEKHKRTIYIEFDYLPGMKRIADNHSENGSKRWCNILNIRSISKARIIYPIKRGIPSVNDGQLREISYRIVSQIGLRGDLYSTEKSCKKLEKENEELKQHINSLKHLTN